MKKTITMILMALMLALPFASADTIMPNTHAVDRSVFIDNIESFSDYVFVGQITGPMSDIENQRYLIESDIKLFKGYKFNELNVYAVEKTYFEEVGLEGINFESENVFISNVKIEPYGGYVENKNPMVSEEIIYSIINIEDKLNLQKTTHVQRTEAGSVKDVMSKTIENEDETGTTSNEKPVLSNQPKINLWDNIIYFLKSLFSR